MENSIEERLAAVESILTHLEYQYDQLNRVIVVIPDPVSKAAKEQIR